MENLSGQASRELEVPVTRIPGYLSVKEAARIIGVSKRSVYGYIETGKLPGARIGHLIVVDAAHVQNYQRKAPGRLRTNTPAWHMPPVNNLQYLTSITVHVRPGQSERLDQKLNEIRIAGKHLQPGTAARYIARNQHSPSEVQIVLVWRRAVMPPKEERESAFAALCSELAEILDWETAVYKEGQVLMHA